MENEQEYNHQLDSAFTPEVVKEIIGFDPLQAEVQAWGDILRDTLHGFSSPEEERRYQQTMEMILDEIVSQATMRLNQEREPAIFLKKIKGPSFPVMIDGLLAH